MSIVNLKAAGIMFITVGISSRSEERMSIELVIIVVFHFLIVFGVFFSDLADNFLY